MRAFDAFRLWERGWRCTCEMWSKTKYVFDVTFFGGLVVVWCQTCKQLVKEPRPGAGTVAEILSEVKP